MAGIKLLHKLNLSKNNSNITIVFFLIFSFPIFIFSNVYADETEIQIDWLIEGEVNKENNSLEKTEIVSNYEERILDIEQNKQIYEKFITTNQYSIGDHKITIHSKEGQILNGVLIEQRDIRQESFQHKIKYYDRFSDGYVQIAEALLDPIGDSKYIIKGVEYDYNPNSNLELFVLERGYSLDDLESIPNDVFSPKEFTLGRELMAQAQKTGKGEFDLRDYSPNHLLLNNEQIKERMMNTFSEQTSKVFNDIMSGEKLQYGIMPNLEMGESEESITRRIFDNFKFEQPKFENTRHVRDSLQSSTFNEIQLSKDSENTSILILIFLGLTIFGYVLCKRFFKKKLEELPLQVIKPQIDYKRLTKQMIDVSLSLYNDNHKKDAHEKLSQAIRYYYSQNLKIYKELTNHELLSILKKSQLPIYSRIKNWLFLCGSVEYAKYPSNDQEFNDALMQFSKEVV